MQLRKSVGDVRNMTQPARNFSTWFPLYDHALYSNASDYIRQQALAETSEPEYTTLNKSVDLLSFDSELFWQGALLTPESLCALSTPVCRYMAPQRDYALIGTIEAPLKSVGNDL